MGAIQCGLHPAPTVRTTPHTNSADYTPHHTAVKEKYIHGASEAAQQVKVLAPTADHVSPMPGTHMVKEGIDPHKLPPDLHTLTVAHSGTHI